MIFELRYNKEIDRDSLEYSTCNNAFPFHRGKDVLGQSFIFVNFGLHYISVWDQTKDEVNVPL
jgi:hypothetical protein